MKTAYVNFDGAAKGNPGFGSAAAICDCQGETTVKSEFLYDCTSNEAEYQGLILGLELAIAQKAKRVYVRGDSQLIIKQLKGEYECQSNNLLPFYRKALSLRSKFSFVELKWVKRKGRNVLL